MQTLDAAMQDVIGKSQGLSFNDIHLVNLMYGCAGKGTDVILPYMALYSPLIYIYILYT